MHRGLERRREGGRRRERKERRGRMGRKGVRFMEPGKLKVIKSEDYSTAKLLKFLREVEGFRPVLNSIALGGQQYAFFTIYSCRPPPPLLTLSYISLQFFLSPSVHQAYRQYQPPAKFSLAHCRGGQENSS